MGTDVHAHFEIKVDGEWLHYSQPRIKRNYELFEKMAGVRGDIKKAIAPIRGLPKDDSKTVYLDNKHWDSDGYGHSWFNSHEVKELIKFHENQKIGNAFKIELDEWGFLYGNGWGEFNEYRNEYPDWVEDFRLIFWFDS